MVKVIGSAIAGYIVIFVMMFALMTLAWIAVGINGAFQPGVWDVTPMWLFLMVAASIIAAIAGGYVTSLITPNPLGPKILAGIVLVLGRQ